MPEAGPRAGNGRRRDKDSAGYSEVLERRIQEMGPS